MLNFTILSLASTQLYSLKSPLYVNDHFSFINCEFQRFTSVLFYNQNYLHVENTNFKNGLEIIIIKNHENSNNHLTIQDQFYNSSSSFEYDASKKSMSIINCLFSDIKAQNIISIANDNNMTLYITRSTFINCTSDVSNNQQNSIIYLQKTRCLTMTHVCTYQCGSNNGIILNVKNSLIGKYKTNFSENISIKLQNGKTVHFNCIVLCITSFGIANENDTSKIEKIGFVFDENIEVFILKQKIEKEKNHLIQMLSNSMPSRIVESFINTKKSVSFIVQTVSIGSIRVKVQKQFDENTPDEFIFYNQIFKRFDEEISSFDLLSKLNIFSHTYTFIGGLFSEINKPERHAEESIKFALSLLKITNEMSEKYGAEIQLTIGVHTGGPIVAGVISFEKPTFQIIGTVSEIANQMKNNGTPQTICISRAVYELIFSSGFNVQEQGDVTVKGRNVISTYLVRP